MFCPQFHPVVGGVERQAAMLAAALTEAGCRITILTPRIDPDSPDIEEATGVTIERFPMTNLSRRYPLRGMAVFNIPYILWQIARAVRPRLQGADVLHCHMGSLETAGAALAGRMAHVPVLCTAATAGHRSDLGNLEKNGASGWLVAWLVRTFIQTWVALTVAVQEALIRAGVEPGKIVRIPNGVDLPDKANTETRSGRVRRFLYLGRLSTTAQRHVPTLIKAFDRLATLRTDVELAIVGDGDMFEDTQRLAQSCAARDRIHLPGFDRPEKWLAWADCFVLPSKYEGLSVALLEAMAAGLPCIANDIPPNREVLADGEAGILVPVEDLDALEKAMRDMTEKSVAALHYSRMASERVEQCYSIRAVAARYLELYRSLHAGSPVR